MILDQIMIQKRKDLAELKERFPLQRLKTAVQQRERSTRSFKKALSNTKRLNLICELKKASPSEGVIREDFQPLKIASIFEYAGAAAISVLTETHFFKGRPSYLKTVRQITSLPILRKDFIFESYQLYESALLDADAFLLIASLLTDSELSDLIQLGRALGMETLVEIHSEEDLKKAVQAKAEIIGINNRDLHTLTVDPNRAKKLIPHIPKDVVIVIESGISRHEELVAYRTLGAHAFLIGTTLMKSQHIAAKIHELMGTPGGWAEKSLS